MSDFWIDPGHDDAAGDQVTVQNLSNCVLPGIETILEAVPARTLALEGRGAPGAIAVVLTTDEHLQELHHRHLQDDSPTDIMTFPYSSEGEPVSGDIVISVDRAAEQAAAEGWSLEDELVFIVIHGVLHLCGWDDQDDASRSRMLARQREIMTQLELPA